MPLTENENSPNNFDPPTPLDLAGRQVTYDREQLRQEFLAHLDELFLKLQKREIADVLGEDFSNRARAIKRQLDERLRGEFRVVVMGDFKRGKSTLVNALLQREIAPTNVTPETITINEIAYGEKIEAEVCLADHGRISLSPADLAADALAPLLENLAEKNKAVTHLEIKAPVEWLRHAHLVDTPGLGDVLGQFDVQVQEYLNQADAIVYLISALSPLSETESDFLRLSLAPQDFPKIIFVVNMLDMAQNDDSAERVVSHVTQKIARLFPNAQIYGLSAYDEVCRLNNQTRPNGALAPVLENNFREFRTTLESSILLDRDLIQLDRAGDLLRLTLADFERSTLLLKSALEKKESEINESVARLSDKNSEAAQRVDSSKQNFKDEVARLGEQAVGWINEFFDRVEKEAVVDLATGSYKYDEVQRYFHFFLSDALREAVAQCENAHRESISQASETAFAAISRETQAATGALEIKNDLLAAEAAAETTRPDWSKLETVVTVASFFLPVSWWLELGSKAIFKGSEESKKLENYRHELNASLPELRAKSAEKLRAGYKEIADNLAAQMDAAFEKEKKSALAALEQARTLQQNEQTHAGHTSATLDELQRLFGESRAFVRTLTYKLWSQTDALRAEANHPLNAAQNLMPDNKILDTSTSKPITV